MKLAVAKNENPPLDFYVKEKTRLVNRLATHLARKARLFTNVKKRKCTWSKLSESVAVLFFSFARFPLDRAGREGTGKKTTIGGIRIRTCHVVYRERATQRTLFHSRVFSSGSERWHRSSQVLRFNSCERCASGVREIDDLIHDGILGGQDAVVQFNCMHPGNSNFYDETDDS